MADGSAANTNTFSVSLAEGHGLGSLRSCHAPRPCQAGVLATFSTTYIYLYLTASNVSGCVSASYHLNCRLIHGGYNVYTLDTMYHPCRVAAAAPSQQQLRCSSSSVAAAAPSQQHYNLVLEWSSPRRVPPRGAALPRGTAGSISRRGTRRVSSTSRRDARCCSMRSVVVAAAPSQQQQPQATAEPREDSRSTCSYMSESVSATQARLLSSRP